MSTKKGRPKGAKNKPKPLSDTQKKRRYRANKKRQLEAQRDAERRAKRIDVTAPLGIRAIAIANISDADLASEIVTAVITDPPYAKADIPLYGELARFAMRVLKPGGWCLTMVGDLYLIQIGDLMTQAGLIERGYTVVSFPGGHHSRIGTTKTFQAIKLVLMMQKPPTCQPPQWGPNFLIAAPKNGYDKSLHDWQQSQYVFEKLVERFTVEGGVVVDPFAGSGTTLRAALALRRLAWGSDIAATAATTAAPSPPRP